MQGRNEQNQGISRGTNQSRRSYSENKRDGLADIAIVSDADHHFHLWEDCVIDEPEYITTALSRDYIRCEQANKELSKQLEWLETDEEGLFTEVSFEDFEKEMQAREDIAGTNCFKLDFINRIITNLNSIEKELYQEFNTNINNLSKRENQNYTVYLNENEYSECLEYEMVIGKNDDETDKKIKVTVYYSYRSDGYLSIWKENRIDNIFIENINSGKIIKVSNLEYESFYRAVYDSLTETDRKEYETTKSRDRFKHHQNESDRYDGGRTHSLTMAEESMVFDEIRRIGVFKKGITYEFTRDSTTSRSHLEEEESKKIIITCIVF